MLIKQCVCGEQINFISNEQHGIPLMQCASCGIQHQRVELSKQEYFDFYKHSYHTETQAELGLSPYETRYAHDRTIAELRFKEYQELLTPGSRILDIGSSNNAFVDFMNERGFKTNGVELGEQITATATTTYNKDLLDIHFPPNSFDMITMHDVFEHLITPIDYLRECCKILSDGGRLVIDFPHYFTEAGLHHWRPIQHLWYFTVEELKRVIEQYGFEVTDIKIPVDSKVVVYARKRPQPKPKRILMLPGMGDIYWSLVKLESFAKANNFENPEVVIWNMDGRPRSDSFLSKIPFIKNGGYYNKSLDSKNTPTFNAAYHHTTSVVEKFEEFDYFFGVNGLLTSGHTLEHGQMAQYKSDWYFPMFSSLEEINAGKQYKEQFGRYIVAFVGDLGMFKHWTSVMTPTVVHTILDKIGEVLNAKIIMTGLEWDAPYTNQIMALDNKDRFVNLVGQTNLDQFFGLTTNSAGVWGWCGGNTIKTVMKKVPTMIYWSAAQFPNRSFYQTCVPPDSINNWYIPKVVEEVNMKNDTNDAIRLFANHLNIEVNLPDLPIQNVNNPHLSTRERIRQRVTHVANRRLR